MIKGMVNYWSRFRGTVRGFDTSKQLAMGVTLGMLIGLIPKESLFCYGFGVMLILSTANLLTGAVSACLFAWISSVFDPLSHRIGSYFLTFDMFEPTLSQLNQLPVVPWTRFENTVVTGSLLLGLLLAVPVYQISRSTFERYGKTVATLVVNTRLGRLMLGLPNNPETEIAQS